jgi:metal-sulfur cluster biosynthetic enzyme
MSDETINSTNDGAPESPESPDLDQAPSAESPSAESPSAESQSTASKGAAADGPPPTSEQVKLALRKVKDPELNLNIIDLGLVYEISVDGSDVQIDMTLTSPGCPAGPQIMGDVERAVKAMPGVTEVNINLVWQPFWSPEKIEPRVRAYMGL